MYDNMADMTFSLLVSVSIFSKQDPWFTPKVKGWELSMKHGSITKQDYGPSKDPKAPLMSQSNLTETKTNDAFRCFSKTWKDPAA